MNFGGIVLCGGQSSRMGLPKPLLPFGPELMLQRVVRLLSEVVGTIVVVAAPGQELPELPCHVHIAVDRQPGQGPLEGLRAGLEAVEAHVPAAYATSCDVPLLQPAFVRRMFEHYEQSQCRIAVPEAQGYLHPLAAVYAVDVRPRIEELLAAGRLSLLQLCDQVSTRRVIAEELRDVDPELRSLVNLNCPSDYLSALAIAGFFAPPDVVTRLKEHAARERTG
jgi:molybdopterin-guanine dinucleotide biosynthesis protein A